MPSKRSLEAAVVRDLFRAENPQFRNIPWIPITKLSEAGVAEVLGASAVYLSLCRLDACPLALLEAFASGCIIAGFAGIGGRDFTTARNGYWAEDDDCLGCTDQLTKAVSVVTAGGTDYQDMLSEAVITAQQNNRERFVTRLVEFFASASIAHSG